MERRRTPDERFVDLPAWPYRSHHVEVADPDGAAPLRLAYVDEGEPVAGTVLLLHGEPTWGYLYRHVIPTLVDAELRVVVPDLVGFGRSDKPTRIEDHTYARHVAWLREALFDHLDLREVVLFCQDWGGLLGLRLVAEHPERFRGVVASNTGLPTGDGTPTEAFLAWQQAARTMPEFPTGRIVDGGTLRSLTAAEIAAYDAPFPAAEDQAGPRAMPALVPTSPDDPAAADNRAAWDALGRFPGPILTAFSDQDPITRGGDRRFRDRLPGAAGLPHRTIEGAGHFVQEDAPAAVADAVLDLLALGGDRST